MFTCAFGSGHLTRPRDGATIVPTVVRKVTYQYRDIMVTSVGYETVRERSYCPDHARRAQIAYRRLIAEAMDEATDSSKTVRSIPPPVRNQS